MLNKDFIAKNKNLALHTEGNRLLNAEGQAVLLAGANCAGLEWLASDGEKILKRIEILLDQWNANVVRIPLSQDRWFGYGPDQKEIDENGESYRDLVDDVVNIIAERKKYVILDLHWNNCGVWGGKIGQHAMPDTYSVNFWHDFSQRYENHPNVLFNLYNEPYPTEWEIWQSGGYNKKENFAAVGMQTLANTVRANGAKNVLVIGGIDWGFDLSRVEEFPICDRGGNGIIYDSHIYPWKPADYNKYVPLSLAAKYPILIGECGHYGDEAKPREGKQRSVCAEWVPELLEYVTKNGYHITAWDFHPKAGPCLIKDFDGTPTPFWGSYFKDFLAKRK